MSCPSLHRSTNEKVQVTSLQIHPAGIYKLEDVASEVSDEDTKHSSAAHAASQAGQFLHARNHMTTTKVDMLQGYCIAFERMREGEIIP